MSKITIRFNSQAEKEAYFGNDPIPCKYLVIVNDGGNEVLYTSSNNGGTQESQGGYIPSPAQDAKIEAYDTALPISQEVLEGEDKNTQQ